LDALLADPGGFQDLPPEEQDDIYRKTAGLEAMLRAVIMIRSSVPPPSSEPERAVLLAEAATLLAMSKDYLYRHWSTLGGYRDNDFYHRR